MRTALKSSTVGGRRYISITQPSTVIIPSSIGLTSKVKHAQEIASTKLDSENPQFQALGTPPTLLSLQLPASVPVYIRKGSLLSIYGVYTAQDENLSMSSIRNQLEIVSPLKRFLYGDFVSSYQRLVSTIPFSILVTANSRSLLPVSSKSTFGKSFATLALDGTTDWALFPSEALQVYTGSSLIVSNQLLPKSISKKLSNFLKVPSGSRTGLFSFFRAGYTFLSGRGYVGVVGNGQLYKIELKAGEEILINKNNLLAMSINGIDDLQNCVVQESLSNSEESTQEELISSTISEDEKLPESTMKKYWNAFKSKYLSLGRFISQSKLAAFNIITGNKDYIKVIGPRDIILQTNTYVIKISSKTISSPINTTENLIHSKINSANEVFEIQNKPDDYLSYVTIKKGSVAFESTPNFDKTVKNIENATK